MLFQKYFGGFTNRDSVAREFEYGTGGRPSWVESDAAPFAPHPDFPTDAEILFAAYEIEYYSGYAFVLFERGGELYEVHASHCSCYGLEGQWEVEATSWEALRLRKDWWLPEQNDTYGPEACAAFQQLLARHEPAAA